ncbi:MAG: gluconate 2-dehydrogenase subunit 3 family protein [bacterium]
MERRDFLRTVGASAVLALLPRESALAWTRVRSGTRPSDGLTDPHLALVGAIADVIIPRTDSPSATDVGVPAFVDIIVSEQLSDSDRDAFVAGLDGITTTLQSGAGVDFGERSSEEREKAIAAIEALTDRRAEPQRTYWRLKGLIVHGYFTSEPVMKDVLKTEIMPGRFDGAAPMPLRAARTGDVK